jgi:hypothetical protein
MQETQPPDRTPTHTFLTQRSVIGKTLHLASRLSRDSDTTSSVSKLSTGELRWLLSGILLRSPLKILKPHLLQRDYYQQKNIVKSVSFVHISVFPHSQVIFKRLHPFHQHIFSSVNLNVNENGSKYFFSRSVYTTSFKLAFRPFKCENVSDK